uniref:C2H2-type domain-containing protein n=1 Tax=Nothobranchius furzeri TaxID=105023 RepID=A0A8C6LRV2_NOTFU
MPLSLSEQPGRGISIKSEDDAGKPVLSQLHHQQIEDRDVPTSSSDDQRTAETGGEVEISSNSDLNPHEQTSDSELSDFWPESGERVNDSFFSCPECGKQFVQKWSLKIHLRVMGHSEISSSDCLVNNKCEGGEQPADSLTKKTSLNQHMRSHSGQKPFACELCGQRFGEKAYLTRHMNVHTEHKPFACGHCGIRFSRKEYLTRHMSVHTGHKPFVCGHCGKRFYKKAHLKTHVSIHTGQKPFACELCGKRFCQKSNLNKHMRVSIKHKKINLYIQDVSFVLLVAVLYPRSELH